ncbi:MAG: TauD/TfdA family dioxygenase [Gammaproteobacteria bacterium]|nr:TauD/TfdA family dioxygenase [Gammaproteobacteria bacterium]
MARTKHSRSDGGVAASDHRIPDHDFGGRFAWKKADLKTDDWRVAVTAESLLELETIASALPDFGGNIEGLKPDAFHWPATTEVMSEVKSRLDLGVGFAVLDRLPAERWAARTTKAIGWLLTSMLGPIVKQKLNGVRLYDVRDTGTPLSQGVRRSITNLEQEFHTDGGWLPETPEFIALVCVRQAASGGSSRVASLATAHKDLYARDPALLVPLYKPLWWDRQSEHEKGEPLCSRRPIYSWDGDRPNVRYYDDYVRKGHSLMNEQLDERTEAALVALREAMEDPANGFDFLLEPGQVEFANNRLIAHARDAFKDGEAGDYAGRLMVRLWVRRSGGLELEPAIVAADA